MEKTKKAMCPCCGNISSLKIEGAGYKCNICNSIVKEPLYIIEDLEQKQWGIKNDIRKRN